MILHVIAEAAPYLFLAFSLAALAFLIGLCVGYERARKMYGRQPKEHVSM